jgi:hypothetical protein
VVLSVEALSLDESLSLVELILLSRRKRVMQPVTFELTVATACRQSDWLAMRSDRSLTASGELQPQSCADKTYAHCDETENPP